MPKKYTPAYMSLRMRGATDAESKQILKYESELFDKNANFDPSKGNDLINSNNEQIEILKNSIKAINEEKNKKTSINNVVGKDDSKKLDTDLKEYASYKTVALNYIHAVLDRGEKVDSSKLSVDKEDVFKNEEIEKISNEYKPKTKYKQLLEDIKEASKEYITCTMFRKNNELIKGTLTVEEVYQSLIDLKQTNGMSVDQKNPDTVLSNLEKLPGAPIFSSSTEIDGLKKYAKLIAEKSKTDEEFLDIERTLNQSQATLIQANSEKNKKINKPNQDIKNSDKLIETYNKQIESYENTNNEIKNCLDIEAKLSKVPDKKDELVGEYQDMVYKFSLLNNKEKEEAMQNEGSTNGKLYAEIKDFEESASYYNLDTKKVSASSKQKELIENNKENFENFAKAKKEYNKIPKFYRFMSYIFTGSKTAKAREKMNNYEKTLKNAGIRPDLIKDEVEKKEKLLDSKEKTTNESNIKSNNVNRVNIGDRVKNDAEHTNNMQVAKENIINSMQHTNEMGGNSKK